MQKHTHTDTDNGTTNMQICVNLYSGSDSYRGPAYIGTLCSMRFGHAPLSSAWQTDGG